MKKIIFITIALFTFSFVKAQDVSFGLKAGLNMAKFSYSESEYNDMVSSRTAFHIGGVADFSFSDQFSVQTDLLYNSVGSKVKFSDDEDAVTIDAIVDYLSIPIMAKYYVAEGLSLQAGPQIGFLLGAKMKAGGEEEDFKDDMESLDFGLGFGGGYKMDNGLFFDARYVLGLSNIAKETEDNEWAKNNVIQISLGYLFN